MGAAYLIALTAVTGTVIYYIKILYEMSAAPPPGQRQVAPVERPTGCGALRVPPQSSKAGGNQ